jgi:hypothetical protein
LKRLLDTWNRNWSTSGPNPWQLHDDNDISNWSTTAFFQIVINFLVLIIFPVPMAARSKT